MAETRKILSRTTAEAPGDAAELKATTARGTPEPYVRKSAGDIIRADDWNTAQVLARADLIGHDHTELGQAIPREAIRAGAIDGSRIDPDAVIAARTLALKDSLKIGARDVIADLDRAFSALEQSRAALDKTNGDLARTATTVGTLNSQLAQTPQQTLSQAGLVVSGDPARDARNLLVDGDLQLKSGHKFHATGRLHISGDEILYLLNKSGVIIGKEWGGNGKLDVQGELIAQGNLTARGGLTFGDGSRQNSAMLVQGGTWDCGEIKNGTAERTIGLSGFTQPPTVLVSMAVLDSSKSANLRIRCWADTVSAGSFRLVAQSWGDTYIYAIGGTWIAFGR
ncbi:H-type lectin domain-containing protein [Chitiniphilus shinanonensis]|uniref:H-type lectin domain-containing protein n=1 Tax=Chitiniphilus shinanonensis TaxID=553088 RepID=UPI003071D2EF